MKRTTLAWYAFALLLVFGPVGVRMYCWPRQQTQDVTDAESAAGKTLFTHEWKAKDPLSASGDGLGPVFNATSCVACHHLGGVGGSGGLEHNVTTFIVQSESGRIRHGVVHTGSLKGFEETLALVHPQLGAISRVKLEFILPEANIKMAIPDGVHLSQRNTPALFGASLIDGIPDRVIIAQEKTQRLAWGLAPAGGENAPVGRALRLKDGRIGKFGWKAQSASLIDFVEAACANELGLGNPGSAQPTPLGQPNYRPPGLDLTTEQCQNIAAFIAALPRPEQDMPDNDRDRARATNGQRLFNKIGCAACHTPNLGSIAGIYSDLLLHNMGTHLRGTGGYNSPPPTQPESPGSPGHVASEDEWRTPPLWGVADSAPYLHDGRAPTLQDAIILHGGQGVGAARRFQNLDQAEQNELLAFLKSLRAPG